MPQESSNPKENKKAANEAATEARLRQLMPIFRIRTSIELENTAEGDFLKEMSEGEDAAMVRRMMAEMQNGEIVGALSLMELVLASAEDHMQGLQTRAEKQADKFGEDSPELADTERVMRYRNAALDNIASFEDHLLLMTDKVPFVLDSRMKLAELADEFKKTEGPDGKLSGVFADAAMRLAAGEGTREDAELLTIPIQAKYRAFRMAAQKEFVDYIKQSRAAKKILGDIVFEMIRLKLLRESLKQKIAGAREAQ